MRLTDLFPSFLKIREATSEEIADSGWQGDGPHWLLCPTDVISEADGIRFTDPIWAAAHPGQDGHDFGGSVYAAFSGHDPLGLISRDTEGKPSAWAVSGTVYADLKLTPSIFINAHGNPPGWHGFIGLNVPGEITNA